MCGGGGGGGGGGDVNASIGVKKKGGGDGGGGAPAQQPAPAPAPQAAPAAPAGVVPTKFTRPATEVNAPSFLQMPGAMTPLQARSMIATYGAAAGGSKWRDPAAVAYYKNLVQRQLIGPDGSPMGTVLPVEREYLGALLGGQQFGPSTTDFLSALEGL